MHRPPRPARLARGSTPTLLLAASACAALSAGCLADDAGDAGAPLGAATTDVVVSAPPLMAYRESYLQSAIVPGRPLPAPISRGVGGSFACDPTTTTLGVAESRSADGSHTYRLRCARPTARGVVEDHLALVLDERVATETDRAEARACAATFARYGTPRNEYFTATLSLGGVACSTNGSAVATMLAQSAATGGQHPGVITPGLAHPSVPANVIPAAPLEISPHAGQRATLPPWAIAPAADVVMLTSDPTRPIHLAVQSRANPADLTSFDPDAYPSEIIGYTLQFATEPTATTSCATWTDVPGFIGEQFVALHDTPVAALSLPSGLPIWTHDLDVPLPYLDLGPWTDDAHLSHTFWVRAVPRGPVLGGGPGDPPLPGVPGLDASACAFTPSNWVPIGVFDDALYSQHVFAELTQQLAAYVAKQPYDPATLYEVKLLRYAPPRLVDRAPIDHTIDVFGFTFSFPTVPVVSEVNNAWGAHRGFAFDPYVLGSAVAAANSHWYDTFVDLGNLLIDALSLASELYESAKTFVADTVALVGCTQVPVDGCNDFVSGAAKLGIEYGLASMGIPPHIPNARELMDKGVDYLAAMAADEVAAQVPGGGVVAAMTARELAYAAVKQSVHDALDAMPLSQEYDNDDVGTWGQPDPFYRSHPATLTIAVRPKQPATYAQILATEPQRVPDLGFVIVRDLTCGYGAKTFRLPKVIPAQGVVLTVPLTASFELGAPGTTLSGQGCSIWDPAAWTAGFGALDPTDEYNVGVRYPAATRKYFFTLQTFHWLTKTPKSWDARYDSVGLARVFAYPTYTPRRNDGIPAPKPFWGQ